MKKEKTQNGKVPSDGAYESPEIGQTQQGPATSNSTNEAVASASEPTTQSSDELDGIAPNAEPQPGDYETAAGEKEEFQGVDLSLGNAGYQAVEPSLEENSSEKAELPKDDLAPTGAEAHGEKPEGGTEQVPTEENSDLVLRAKVTSYGRPNDPYIYSSPYDSAIAIGKIGPPAVLLDEVALKGVLEGLWTEKILSGLDETGRLVGAQKFDNDPEKIFRKGRKPGVVFAAIEKLLGAKIDRRRIAESTRAYGVELELRQTLAPIELNYSQRAQIGRLEEKTDRILLAFEAHDEKLSVDRIKKRVSDLLRKDGLDDQSTGQALLRELQTASNLLRNEDIQEFVRDEKRLKTLTPEARLRIRSGIEGALTNVTLTSDALNDLESVLWNIELAERGQKAAPVKDGSVEKGQGSDQ